MPITNLLSVSKYPYFVLLARAFSLVRGLQYLFQTEAIIKSVQGGGKKPTVESIHSFKIIGILLLACTGYAHVALQASQSAAERSFLFSCAAITFLAVAGVNSSYQKGLGVTNMVNIFMAVGYIILVVLGE